MARWAAFLSIFIAPYLVLRLPGVPQTLGRTIAASILLLGAPVAIIWFGLKSQMIRPDAKLYQPQFDKVRPRIEWAMRIPALAFGVFFFVLTLPLGEDLFLLAAGQKRLRITKTVKFQRFGKRGSPRESIGLSDEDKPYQLYYPTKALRLGDTYEFIVLPRSRMILDYRESNK